uniref:Intraflagellar transport protein 140 homolog n=1 Tax=Clastoptera arizonana TaxID=38151 RepID=A0A1B6C8A4_9HEMI
MTLYFDSQIHLEDPNCVIGALDWHSQQSLLAIATHSIERGGTICICNELGESIKDVHPATSSTSQALCVAWHPSRKILVTAWERGELRIWTGEIEFLTISSPHTAPILILQWSRLGGRLISIDSSGLIIGWRLDSRGQLITVYRHMLSSMPKEAVFRISRPGPDLTGLAKRAVAGDQVALDMFSAWRPRTAGNRATLHQDNMNFYVCTVQGIIYYVTENGKCTEVLNHNNQIEKLLYQETDDGLVIVGEGLQLSYYSADINGSLVELASVKLSGYGGGVVSWAGSGILACAVGSTTVRCWEPATGDSYCLATKMDDNNISQTITCLAYSSQKDVLCGGTNLGNILFWKNTSGGWEPMAGSKVRGSIKACSWGGAMLAVNAGNLALLLQEHNLCAAYSNNVSVVQLSASQLLVKSNAEQVELNTDLQVCGVCVSKEHIVVWSNKMVAVYQHISLASLNVIGSFPCEVDTAVIHEQSIIVVGTHNEVKIQIHTLQGTIKQTLDCDGQPICMTLTKCYLTVATINGIIQIWDLSRREAKPHSQPKDLVEGISDFGEVICARCNSSGNKIALTVAGSNLLPVPRIYVWDIDTNIVHKHSFTNEGDVSRFVINFYWDQEEPRLLVCEAKKPPSTSVPSFPTTTISLVKKNVVGSQEQNTTLVSFVVTSEHSLLLQDSLSVPDHFVSLLAVNTPYFVVLTKPSLQPNIIVDNILMRDFEGLENCDANTKSAVLNFSFSLSIGDIDQAFKAIRNVNSIAVWSSLARLCVKARRLDVARVCLGNMKDARGMMTLRHVQDYPEIEAQLAALAVHLGLIEEAEKLYKSCNKWDLLNKFYQNRGQWDKAISLAEEKDRIHLRHTYHCYAKYLEVKGDTELAVQMYQKADTHRAEVTRMLLDDYFALESYIQKSKDPALIKWWAQYMESSGDMDLAMKHYNEAGDHLSMVRVMCFLEDFEKAAEIANNSGDRAACYHLARQYENMGRIQEAVHFFSRATAYANAIRMCKEQNLEDQLWNLALSAGPREQLEAARHLELSSPDKAILLYHRAGMLHRALDLAFRCEQYDAVQLIAQELNSDSDIELLVKCSRFFIEKDQFEKAVELLAIAKQYREAISLCWEHSVQLTEELADNLTPAQGYEDRAHLLEQLAECALSQANYHLATKKYTQAGNKIKAMKALLKSGDTEKVIFFATVSRQREIYIMAANYLQSLDWQAKPELLKSIITFYTKGRAPNLLANFYIACAQVEIDEYGNYEKALGALNEASRCLAKDADQYSSVVESVANKTAHVKKFLDIRRMFERGDSDNGMVQCRHLLSSPNDLVRCGDIYSVMIEHTTKSGDWKVASQLALELKRAQPHDSISLYIPKELLEKLGIETPGKGQEEQENPDIEEEVVDIT